MNLSEMYKDSLSKEGSKRASLAHHPVDDLLESLKTQKQTPGIKK
jgi:hypothetical protein